MVSDIRIKLPCKLGWAKIRGYDNRGNTGSKISRTVEVQRSISISSTDFTRAVSESSREEANKIEANTSLKATYAVVEASVSAGLEHSTTMRELLSSTKEITRKEEFKQSESVKEEFVITAGDQLYFYQRVFRGPGLSCTLDITETSSDPSLESSWTDVEMTVLARPRRFIKHMGVAYGQGEAEAPDDRIRELTGQSDDINKGQKGEYVWMVPEWTYDSDEAATGFEIRIQENSAAGWQDLAKGAGGLYRYVYTNHNSNDVERVVGAKLIRSDHALSADAQVAMLNKLGKGWVAGTRDINEGRGGSYIYLAYQLF